MFIRKLVASVVVMSGVMGAMGASANAFADETDVNVLYAGSLVNLMEKSVGPAFEKETGLHFKGYAAGSNKIANEIKGKLRRGDVFISASPKVNASLTGEANGNHVTWYVNFAESPLLIGYNPKSRFANDFKTKKWDQVLQEPGIRLGRTDPKLDPKGAFTVELMTKAAQAYNQPDLVEKTLGAPENPEQVLPEETLVGRLQSGQLDAGFFYSSESGPANIPTVPVTGVDLKASYTVTILANAPHPSAAESFVNYLLGSNGQAALKQAGFSLESPYKVTGTGVPASLSSVLP